MLAAAPHTLAAVAAGVQLPWALSSLSRAAQAACRHLEQQQQWQQHSLSMQAVAHAPPSGDSSSSSEAPYDVCVVGAGMVGAALIALLRSHPLTASMRVAVIDQQPPPMTLDTPRWPDLRVSTITPANMRLLQHAGAWAELEPLAPTFQHMQVWEFAGPGFISWHSSEVGLPYMGCVVENRLLQAALLRTATGAASSSGSGSSSSSSGSDGGCLDLLCPQSVQSVWLPSGSSGGPQPPRLQQLLQQQQQADGPGAASGGSGSSAPAGNSLAEVELAGGRRLRCRLLVAADGARSRVRQLAGLRTTGWSYNQRGLVATVETAEPSDTAWQRFLPTGPLALLPVRGGFSNVVWTVPPEVARRLEAASSGEFADAVNEALQPDPATFGGGTSGGTGGGGGGAAAAALSGLVAGALGRVPLVGPLLGGAAAAAASAVAGGGGSGGGYLAGEAGLQGSSWRQPPLVRGWVGSCPKSFPLQMQHSGRYAAPRMALVGDAAHAVHPMAGQGVNLGLGDAAALAAALAHAREVGQDVGDLALLQARYEAPQQRANLRMMAALEVLWRGFGVQQGLAGSVRAAGLGLLNGVGPLKNGIMKYAMGLA